MIIGGDDVDNIDSGTDDDLILGDHGVANFSPPGTLANARTFEPTIGAGDIIVAGSGNDVAFGGAGGDTIGGDDGRDVIFGDHAQVDYLVRDGDPLTADLLEVIDPLLGGADNLSGGAQEDVIFGGTDADAIWGGADHDLIMGDHGLWDRALPANQRVQSTFITDDTGAGNDTVHGDAGDDFIWGQQGQDQLFGDDGQDDITGGHNVLTGADTDDWIDGGADADVILGDNGLIVRELLPNRDNAWQQYPLPFDDVIREVMRFDDQDRVSGDDTIFGGPGDDIVHGQRGEDTISGGDDDDELLGELGDDQIQGDGGNDILLADVGYITRDFQTDGTPRVNENGSWHRDILLEEVASIAGIVDADTTPLRTSDPELSQKLLSADVIVVTGAGDASGGKRTNSDNGAWDVDLLLVNLVAPNHDVLDGGDGEDVVIGQRGNDNLAGGGGDDFVVGDNAINKLPFDTELPHITHGIRLIEVDTGVTVPIELDPQGNLITPPIELEPQQLTFNKPFWLADTFGNIVSEAIEEISDAARAKSLSRSDGALLTPLAAIVPDAIHHADALPGNDTIAGNAGDDMLVGDQATFYWRRC